MSDLLYILEPLTVIALWFLIGLYVWRNDER
jgi:hypothetical protein